MILYAMRDTAPPPRDVPNVTDCTDLTHVSQAANWKGIRVHATAVAGNDETVPVLPAVPA